MESVRVGDDYRIERKLASGGFGTVYRATQLSLDRQVCIKRIHPHMLGQGEIDAVSMFLDEARLVAKLRHENVCRVIDCLLDAEGVPVIVMEYIEGCDVHSLLKRHGPLPWRTVAYILVEVLKALAEAHEPDPSTERPALIHRDIKPSNIMLGNNGSVVVVDFGIARAVEDASGLNYTDNYKGSLAYAAPEQLRPGTPFDRRVDLWQLGVTAWEMLNGCLKRPFEDESIEPRGTMNRQVWVIRNILEDRRRPIREVFAHLPPEADPLLQLIDELLKPADSRIRNAYDVLERLAHAGLGLVTERREVMALVQEIRPQGPRTVPDTPGYGRGDSPSSAEPTGTTDPSPPPPSAALASGEALPDRPPAALAPPAGPPDAPAHRMTREDGTRGLALAPLRYDDRSGAPEVIEELTGGLVVERRDGRRNELFHQVEELAGVRAHGGDGSARGEGRVNAEREVVEARPHAARELKDPCARNHLGGRRPWAIRGVPDAELGGGRGTEGEDGGGERMDSRSGMRRRGRRRLSGGRRHPVDHDEKLDLPFTSHGNRDGLGFVVGQPTAVCLQKALARPLDADHFISSALGPNARLAYQIGRSVMFAGRHGLNEPKNWSAAMVLPHSPVPVSLKVTLLGCPSSSKVTPVMTTA